MTSPLDQFKSRFHFVPELEGYLGIEREWFFVDRKTGLIVPRSPEVMATLSSVSCQFTYELSACQGESRHGPCRLIDVRKRLVETDELLQRTLRPFGLRAVYMPVAPETIPLDVYPDARYMHLVKDMPRERLSAACRAAGMHVHVGQRDHDQELQAYNEMCEQCDNLIRLGNHSGGHRFALYETVQPNWRPYPYGSWQDFLDDAITGGFEKNPRDNWRLIRLTAKGTREHRMFDSIEDVDAIVAWAEECLNE